MRLRQVVARRSRRRPDIAVILGASGSVPLALAMGWLDSGLSEAHESDMPFAEIRVGRRISAEVGSPSA